MTDVPHTEHDARMIGLGHIQRGDRRKARGPEMLEHRIPSPKYSSALGTHKGLGALKVDRHDRRSVGDGL